MEELFLGYAVSAAYFHGFFNGSDAFRIRPTFGQWLLNLGIAFVWPVGLAVIWWPERWRR